jgi:hypothetical protein
MDHETRPRWLRHLRTAPPMHVGCQRRLVGWLPNMHGRHPVPAIGRSNIFHKLLDVLLGEQAHVMARRRDG